MKVKSYKEEAAASQTQISLADFLEFYNKNIPATFGQATTELLQTFRREHPSLFKHGDMWSLDEHRKKIMDWIPSIKNTG